MVRPIVQHVAALAEGPQIFQPIAIPSAWRSFRKLVSNSANTPSMSRKALPAAVPDRLLSRAQCHSSFLQLMDDVLQIIQ